MELQGLKKYKLKNGHEYYSERKLIQYHFWWEENTLQIKPTEICQKRTEIMQHTYYITRTQVINKPEVIFVVNISILHEL